MENNKFILDPTCSGRMMWFNKNHPNVIYGDIRKEEKGFIKERPNFEINPDEVMDFRDLKFIDKSFKLIIFDPPHIKFRGYKSWASQKYGSLDKETWAADLKKGFDECWRVLEDYGTLIFKWSVERDSRSIKIKDVLNLFDKEPLFGHTTGKSGNTMWMCFMKIPYECPSCKDEGCEICALDELNNQEGDN